MILWNSHPSKTRGVGANQPLIPFSPVIIGRPQTEVVVAAGRGGNNVCKSDPRPPPGKRLSKLLRPQRKFRHRILQQNLGVLSRRDNVHVEGARINAALLYEIWSRGPTLIAKLPFRFFDFQPNPVSFVPFVLLRPSTAQHIHGPVGEENSRSSPAAVGN